MRCGCGDGRGDRRGFKAGALAAGLARSEAELVAIFDADFVPAPDFLQRTVHHFADEKVGVVQAEWRHLNRDESTLTQCQAMFLDGHLVVEQAVRARTGRRDHLFDTGRNKSQPLASHRAIS